MSTVVASGWADRGDQFDAEHRLAARVEVDVQRRHKAQIPRHPDPGASVAALGL